MTVLPAQAVVYDPTGLCLALPGLGAIGEACARHGFSDVVLVCPQTSRPGCDRAGLRITLVAASSPGLGADLQSLAPLLAPDFVLLDAAAWPDINMLDLALAHRAARDRWLTLARAAPRSPSRAGLSSDWLGAGLCVLDRRLVGTLATSRSLAEAVAAATRAGRVGAVTYDRPSLSGDAASPPRPALFLDRDGVVNEDCGFVCDVERFRWVAGTPEAIKAANDRGYLVFVVTNQSGVARGFFGEEAVHLVHRHIQAELRAIGAHVDDFRHCPYYPQGSVPAYARDSSWRKPNPGMLIDLMAHWCVDRSASIMIGDRASDAAAGTAAGIEGYTLGDGETLAHVVGRIFEAG